MLMVNKISNGLFRRAEDLLAYGRGKLTRFSRAAKTILLKRDGRSDTGRWSDPSNLNESWDVRTAALAKFVPPGSSVLEFGAGRRVLPRYLPAGCQYTPSDLVDRGPGTLVCDLNAAQLPLFPEHDVAVFSGVLEYVLDMDRLLDHLAPTCRIIVASYAPTDVAEQQTAVARRATSASASG